MHKQQHQKTYLNKKYESLIQRKFWKFSKKSAFIVTACQRFLVEEMEKSFVNYNNSFDSVIFSG